MRDDDQDEPNEQDASAVKSLTHLAAAADELCQLMRRVPMLRAQSALHGTAEGVRAALLGELVEIAATREAELAARRGDDRDDPDDDDEPASG